MRLKRGAHSAWALTNMPPATPKLGILMWPPTGSRCAVIIGSHEEGSMLNMIYHSSLGQYSGVCTLLSLN